MDASSEKEKGKVKGKEKGKGKEKEKESENGGESRKLWILELEMAERMENDEEIDTNFLGNDFPFCPKKIKRLKTVEVQYSMEKLCSAFDNNSVGRREVTQQIQHNNREEVQGQQNTSNLEELQLQEIPHQDDMRYISETDPSKNDDCSMNDNCA